MIVYNAIMTPDGTIIIESEHRHDFKIHDDKNGKSYGVDGGRDYLRRIGDVDDCTELSLVSSSEFSKVRDIYKSFNPMDGKRHLLKDIPSDDIDKIMENCLEDFSVLDSDEILLYLKEKQFRFNEEE